MSPPLPSFPCPLRPPPLRPPPLRPPGHTHTLSQLFPDIFHLQRRCTTGAVFSFLFFPFLVVAFVHVCAIMRVF